MSENLEPLFSKKGRWVGYNPEVVEALDPTRQELYSAVRDAALACEAAELEVKAAQGHVAEKVRELADAENYLKKHFPPPTQQDLVRESMRTRAHDLGR